MQNEVRKGYCEGYPFDIGALMTEYAFNLGCLPGVGEVRALCASKDTA